MPATKSPNIPEDDASPKEWNSALRRCSGTSVWSRVYRAYMNSLAWSRKRTKVFDEKGMKCTAQLEGCFGIADQVHHKTYKRVGVERLDDLEPVCENCHDAIHS